MTKSCTRSTCAMLLALAFSAVAHAAPHHRVTHDFSSTIRYHNEVAYADFSFDTAMVSVDVWTDSFQSATNFDPIVTLWTRAGSDWSWVGANDDNANVAPGQTWYDSGMQFAHLPAAQYRLTISAYANFAAGLLLSQGFARDGDAPIPMDEWCQPANYCGMGPYWSAHVTGVEATPPVPEPSTYALMLLGLAGISAVAMRRRAE